MVIVLKSACFILWLVVMLAMIAGSKRGQAASYKEVPLYIEKEDELEIALQQMLSHLGPGDRLVIHDSCRSTGQLHRVLIHKLLRDNPSIMYCCILQES